MQEPGYSKAGALGQPEGWDRERGEGDGKRAKRNSSKMVMPSVALCNT